MCVIGHDTIDDIQGLCISRQRSDPSHEYGEVSAGLAGGQENLDTRRLTGNDLRRADHRTYAYIRHRDSGYGRDNVLSPLRTVPYQNDIVERCIGQMQGNIEICTAVDQQVRSFITDKAKM